MNAVPLPVPEVIPRAVYGIRKYAFRVVAICFAVCFHRVPKSVAFVERVPIEIPNPQKTINIAHTDLGAELHRSVLLPLTMGRTPGWLRLTMRSSILALPDSYISRSGVSLCRNRDIILGSNGAVFLNSVSPMKYCIQR